MRGSDRRAISAVRDRTRGGSRLGFADVLSGLVMLLALTIAAGLALVFAATLAVVTAVMTGLVAVSALAWAVRPQPQPQRALVRSRSGHAWISYRIDSSGR